MTLSFARRIGCALFGAALFAAPLAASADVPGPHPAYIHAMHDLRYARALLVRPGQNNVVGPELAAVNEIDRALYQIRQASIDDGKDLYVPEGTDVGLDRHGRLRRALDLLHGAHRDLLVNGESNYAAYGWRNGAFHHVDAAIADTRTALRNLFNDTTFGY